MEKKFEEYLLKIGITKTLSGRINMLFEEYSLFFPEEIQDIFVTNYIKKDEGSQYENLWLFSNAFCMELKSFTTQDNFDCIRMQDNVSYFEINKGEYDLRNVSLKSRLDISITFKSMLRAEFKASGDNCEQLQNIFMKYFLPNI